MSTTPSINKDTDLGVRQGRGHGEPLFSPRKSSTANAVVCQALGSEIAGFLLAGKPVFKIQLAKFKAPLEAVTAKMEVKKCVDMMAYEKRVLITKTLGKIAEKCDR
uniref:secretoglobin family 1D member 1 isoform X1 n=1 Tax=Callithrix jacchus TaxID=9483 RepID=UPI00083FC028|nr:secretoglobin family 1D member 1 isoform X1 [Callithrix jacchus]